MKILLKSFVPAVLWFIFTAFLFFSPGSAFAGNKLFGIPYLDKVLHMAVFFVLTTFLSYPFFKLPNLKVITPLIIITFGTIAYGIAVEFIQENFTTGRSFDFYDIVADAIGTLIATTIFFRIYLDKRDLNV